MAMETMELYEKEYAVAETADWEDKSMNCFRETAHM